MQIESKRTRLLELISLLKFYYMCYGKIGGNTNDIQVNMTLKDLGDLLDILEEIKCKEDFMK